MLEIFCTKYYSDERNIEWILSSAAKQSHKHFFVFIFMKGWYLLSEKVVVTSWYMYWRNDRSTDFIQFCNKYEAANVSFLKWNISVGKVEKFWMLFSICYQSSYTYSEFIGSTSLHKTFQTCTKLYLYMHTPCINHLIFLFVLQLCCVN